MSIEPFRGQCQGIMTFSGMVLNIIGESGVIPYTFYIGVDSKVDSKARLTKNNLINTKWKYYPI